MLVAEYDPVHVAPADADNARAAGLALESDQPEGFLDAGVDEKIRSAVDRGQFVRVRAVGHPVDAPGAFAKLHDGRPLHPVANAEQMVFSGRTRMQDRKCAEERPHILFLRETPDIEEQARRLGNPDPGAGFCPVGDVGDENSGIDAEIDRVKPLDPPCAKQAGQNRAGHERAFKAVVEGLDVALADVIGDRDRDAPKKFCNCPDVGFGEMRMIKPDDRDIEAASGGHGFPCHLVGVAGFDDVRAFFFERLLDQV